MTPQILIVAIRVFAIFWFLTAIGHLVNALRTWRDLPQEMFAILGVCVPVLELAASAFLWFFPATLSRRLLKGGGSPGAGPSPALLEWQAMLLAALGLWTLAVSIPDAVYWIAHFIAYRESEDVMRGVFVDQWAYIAATLAQLVIGLWLLLGAPRLSSLLVRLRSAGIRG